MERHSEVEAAFFVIVSIPKLSCHDRVDASPSVCLDALALDGGCCALCWTTSHVESGFKP